MSLVGGGRRETFSAARYTGAVDAVKHLYSVNCGICHAAWLQHGWWKMCFFRTVLCVRLMEEMFQNFVMCTASERVFFFCRLRKTANMRNTGP